MDTSILDFSSELNITAFDHIVTCFYRSSGEQVPFFNHSSQQFQAKQLLEQFQEHPEAWQRVDSILELSTLTEAKVFVF